MEIEITEKKQNPLLSRTDVRFVARHQGEQTPSRDNIREKLAGQVGGKKSLVVVVSMNSEFGRGVTRGNARVYESPEAIAANEPDHILKRNKLEDVKKKAETGKPEAAPAKK